MRSPRSLTIGATALLAVGAAAGGAFADSHPSQVDVIAAAEAGSRQFFVEDLSGSTLQSLNLGTSGQGQLFQVRVADRDFLSPGSPFTASAELTHLYRENSNGTLDYGTKVTSDKLDVGYVGVPDVTGVALGAIPTVGLTGTLPSCAQLGTLLPVDSPLRGGTLLGSLTDPVNVLLSSLGLGEAAKPLCTALGGDSTTQHVIDTADNVHVQLKEELLVPALNLAGGLPVTVAGSTEAGNFAAPSYLGAGAGDPGKTAAPATTRQLLGGSANAAFNLKGLVSAVVDGRDLYGAGGLTDVTSVVAALRASTDPAVASVGTALSGVTAADQTGVLNGLTGAVAGLVDSVLNKVSGTYRSFPQLKANLTGAPVGTYSGTMTVTFVQQ